MKYRKRPIIIEAYQYNGILLSLSRTPNWIMDAYDNDIIEYNDCDELIIITLEGKMKVNPMDYIIKGVNDELYPCKPDIFEKTYEKVEDNKDV